LANMHPVSRVKNTASARYWEEREQAWIEANKKSDEVRTKQIEYLIDRTMNRCNREIEAFYARYAKKNEMTIADAKKAVKQADIDYLAQKAKEYVASKNFSEQANAEMALYNLTMKVNRLEWLKANLGMEITSSMSEMQKYFEDSLSEETLKSFEHYSGILGKTVHHPADRAKTIIDASWQTAKWSDNIWQYQASLKYHLYDLLQQNLIQGRHPNVLAREVKKAFEVTRYQAERLMRTETARVQTQAAGESLTANGYDHFIFIADMSERTCQTCFGLNGSVGAVKDLKSGTNAPPIHPNCRCSIAAYMPDDEFKKWLASKSKEKAEEKPEEKAENKFVPAKTMKEVRQRISDALGVSKVSTGQMKPELGNEYLKGVERFANDFPQLKGLYHEVNTKHCTGGTCGINYLSGMMDAPGEIAVKMELGFKSPKDVKHMLNMYEYSVRSGHDFDNYTPTTTAIHELVHGLSYAVEMKKNGFFKNGKSATRISRKDWNKYVETCARKVVNEAKTKLYGKTRGQEVFDGTEYLGRYAFTNDDEMLAQAVAYEYTNESREFSRTVLELLRKEVEETFK